MTAETAAGARWRVWVDTGGTFTDCVARDPAGTLRRAKVLSSSALRARVVAAGGRTLAYRARWRRGLPEGFVAGATLHWLGGEAPAGTVTAERAGAADDEGILELAAAVPDGVAAGVAVELAFAEEAPVLAARLVTGTAAGAPLPPLDLRLATTRGTNALLERRGAPTAFFVTRGFADLLRIGDQRRPDLFALDVRRPPPLYAAVVEVDERLAADGSVLRPLDLEPLRGPAAELVAAGVTAAAVALLHSYRDSAHEEILADFLAAAGFRHVAASARLAPTIKILPRAETAVVNAYLAPVVEGYLGRVAAAVGEGRLHVMTSAGGLVRRDGFEPKDSLLSGPAGGVVGAAAAGRREGFAELLLFDMGGTSTDVARFAGDYEYLFEHRVGDATVAAPALAIESVAAGGGSICRAVGRHVEVGPESAGAVPGPACYGAGGPLTVSDVNLLLGRLDPRSFGIPLDVAAAEAAVAAVERELAAAGGAVPARDALLAGFLRIADERMAEAMRRISVRRGYDPRDHALVAFGGAGGQHACAIAEILGVGTVVAPRDGGLLSARGLGAARVERFAQRQVLCPLAEVAGELAERWRELAAEAVAAVVAEGEAADDVVVRRRLAHLRFVGQEATVEVAVDDAAAPLAAPFLARYREVYGYRPPRRAIELESLRVVASTRDEAVAEALPDASPDAARAEDAAATPVDWRRVHLGGGWREASVYALPSVLPGQDLAGPALVLDDHATVVVGVGWRARGTAGALVLERA